MHFKTWISTALLSILFSTSVFAAEASDTELTVTGSKVITEDFSFKLPDHWEHSFTLESSENSCELYKASEEDSSELLFSIDCYEDASLEDLAGCSILGFCGNRTYILVSYYEDLEEASDSFYRFCQKTEKQLKKSFVAYVTE